MSDEKVEPLSEKELVLMREEHGPAEGRLCSNERYYCRYIHDDYCPVRALLAMLDAAHSSAAADRAKLEARVGEALRVGIGMAGRSQFCKREQCGIHSIMRVLEGAPAVQPAAADGGPHGPEK